MRCTRDVLEWGKGIGRDSVGFLPTKGQRSNQLNPYGEKTRPGQCPKQQLIAPAPVDVI